MDAEIEALKQYGVNLKPGHADSYRYEAVGHADFIEQIRPWEIPLPVQIGWHSLETPLRSLDFDNWTNPSFLIEVRQGIAQFTFNEPENNNSFSPGVTDGLVDACRILRNDRRDIRMATLTGAGRMWSAGGDPRGFQASQRQAGVLGSEATPAAPAQLNQNYEESKSRPPDAAGAAEAQPEDEHDSQPSQGAHLEETYDEVGKKAEGEHELYGGPPGFMIVHNEYVESGGEQNKKQGVQNAGSFYAWATIPQFSMALMNGSAMGGALGLLAGSDFVVAVKSAFAVLSEVRLGVIPAVVSPHVIRAIGYSNAKRIFTIAENLNAQKAMEIGLIQRVVTKKDEFPAVVKEIAEKIQAVSMEAVAASKAAIFATLNQPMTDKLMKFVSDEYARVRKTQDCEEGMKALAEDRPTPWSEKKIEMKE